MLLPLPHKEREEMVKLALRQPGGAFCQNVLFLALCHNFAQSLERWLITHRDLEAALGGQRLVHIAPLFALTSCTQEQAVKIFPAPLVWSENYCTAERDQMAWQDKHFYLEEGIHLEDIHLYHLFKLQWRKVAIAKKVEKSWRFQWANGSGKTLDKRLIP